MKIFRLVIAITFALALANCSTPIPTPLIEGDQLSKIPTELTGNWICSAENTDNSTITSRDLIITTQELFTTDGQFQFSGTANYFVNDADVLLGFIGDGQLQMVEGKYWLRLDSSFILPIAGHENNTVFSIVKYSLDRKYPIYEIGSYTFEGNRLTLVSNRNIMKKLCIPWDTLDETVNVNACKTDDNPDCLNKMDKAAFDKEKQIYIEKQEIFE